MMAIERQIADAISRAHRDSGYTQREAANRIGVSVASLRRWLSGEFPPTLPNARVIERVYALEAGSIQDMISRRPARCGHNNKPKGAR